MSEKIEKKVICKTFKKENGDFLGEECFIVGCNSEIGEKPVSIKASTSEKEYQEQEKEIKEKIEEKQQKEQVKQQKQQVKQVQKQSDEIILKSLHCGGLTKLKDPKVITCPKGTSGYKWHYNPNCVSLKSYSSSKDPVIQGKDYNLVFCSKDAKLKTMTQKELKGYKKGLQKP